MRWKNEVNSKAGTLKTNEGWMSRTSQTISKAASMLMLVTLSGSVLALDQDSSGKDAENVIARASVKTEMSKQDTCCVLNVYRSVTLNRVASVLPAIVEKSDSEINAQFVQYANWLKKGIVSTPQDQELEGTDAQVNATFVKSTVPSIRMELKQAGSRADAEMDFAFRKSSTPDIRLDLQRLVKTSDTEIEAGFNRTIQSTLNTPEWVLLADQEMEQQFTLKAGFDQLVSREQLVVADQEIMGIWAQETATTEYFAGKK